MLFTQRVVSGIRSGNGTGRRYRRVKVPTVLQMEHVECGAAAFAMILAHFGKQVPLEELREACGISRDGSKASRIIKAARRYELIAAAYRKEPGELPEGPLPAIIHWKFNHFVVLEGFGKDKVYLNDPASGRRSVSNREMEGCFTGVVLTFEPAPNFIKADGQPGMLRSLQSRLTGSSVALMFIVLTGVALVFPTLVVPAFSKVYIDDILVKGMSGWLRPLLMLMVAVGALSAFLTWTQKQHLLRLETRLSIGASSRFLSHVLNLPIGFFVHRSAGEIGSRVAINDRVARLLSGDLASGVLNLIVIVFFVAVMAQYDVVLTLWGVAAAGVNIVVLRLQSGRRTDLSQSLIQDRGKLMGVGMGGLQTIETLKATGSESDFFTRWSAHQAKVVNTEQRMRVHTGMLSTLPSFLRSINAAVLLGVGGLRVVDGHLTMGTLIAFGLLLTSFIAPVNNLVDVGGVLQEVRGEMKRLDDVLKARTDSTLRNNVEAAPHQVGSPKLAGFLELRNVTFGYSPMDAPLIENLNISLRPGSRVALVGGSGSGKSTIAKLVTGLYERWSGEILFDGVPQNQIPRNVLLNSIASVDQDIFLFEGSIRENLTMWDSTVPERDLVRAAKDACIHETIVGRIGGYASKLEEGARNFSGGQRQRLEIARALVGKPTILVLDEATSALDPATEKLIDENLRRRGCTCLIVAHRLSTIRDCDEIIVLDQGKIVQRGTHQEMRDAAGPYNALIEAE